MERNMPFGRRPIDKRAPLVSEKRLPPVEKRGAPRDPVQIRATIEHPRAEPQDCFIVNLSQTGALLTVTSILCLPDRFQLRVAGKGCWPVRVVRRTQAKVAVEFV
jgi:hypothetical protein